MQLRLTPLNIISSVLLVTSAYLIVFSDSSGWRILGAIPLLCIALICFIADIIFRTFLKNLKRIWILEFVFIIFAAIVIILIRTF